MLAVAVVVAVHKALARPALEAVAVREPTPNIGSRSLAQPHTHAPWEQAVRVVQRVVRTLVRPEVLLHSR